MKTKTVCLALVVVFTLAAAQVSIAQSLSFTNDATDPNAFFTLDSSNFITSSTGISTLDTNLSNYQDNLSSYFASGPLSKANLSGGGWVFNNADGTVAITNNGGQPGVELEDPSVSYGYAFINTTGHTTNFAMDFSATFPDIDFGASPSQARASLGFSLTNSSPSGSVSASVTQTTSLAENGVATPIADLTLTSGTQTASPSATVANNYQTPGFPGYVAGPGGGPYNELTVHVAGTYDAGAILVVSGRADVIAAPEPPTHSLLAMAALGALVFHFRRRKVSL